jgi:hypothetical protein
VSFVVKNFVPSVVKNFVPFVVVTPATR